MLGARKWQRAARRTQHAMHNSIIATRTYAHAGASSSEQRCSRSPQSQRGPYETESCTHARARKWAAYLQSSVIAQLTSLCVAARQQRLRHISQNAGDTVFDKHKPPSAGGHRVYTVKKCERVPLKLDKRKEVRKCA